MNDVHDRSFAACLADILKVPTDEVPGAAGDASLAEIGWWLATRNLALVPVREPESFQWAGW